MQNHLLQQKLTEHVPLSVEEQQELVRSYNAEVDKLKDENPAEYLRLVQKMNEIFSDLNRDLSAL